MRQLISRLQNLVTGYLIVMIKWHSDKAYNIFYNLHYYNAKALEGLREAFTINMMGGQKKNAYHD